jgi:hypothetical protein
MTLLLALMEPLATVGICVWVITGCALMTDKIFGGRLAERAHAVLRTFYLEIKPFYLYLVAVKIIAAAFQRDVGFWDAFNCGLNICNWYQFKNLDDNDRWKRRRAKLKSKVEVLSGKLVVVPAGNRS